MKIYNSILSRFGFSFLSFLLCATFANAALPVINSVDTLEVTVGEAFTYVITTVDNDAVLYGTSNNLPDGVVRSGATLSGEPELAGVTTIDLFATNGDGTGTATLTLTVLDSLPVITSATTGTGRVDEPFSYTIEATNSPGSFSVLGLTAFPGLALDTTTGIITGTPTATADADIQVSATNDSGTASQQVTIKIFPAVTNPTPGPGVTIISPVAAQTFEGSVTQISVSAEVTPEPNETIDSVYVRWKNPTDPALTDIVLTDMTAVSTDAFGVVTYTGTLEVGFNPSDRQIGGGSIEIEVVAFQTNATEIANAGTAQVPFTIKPIVEFLFPDEAFAMDVIAIDDVFASVRLSTNLFDSITARIAGSSIIDTVDDIDATDNPNGVFNFLATQRIDFPGFYDIRITASDDIGNTTVLERRILISDSLAQPVAVLTAPNPGFTNEVFSAAIFSFAVIRTENVTVQNVGVVGVNITYAAELISGGQGYYPRNASGVTIPASAVDNTGASLTIGVPNVNVVNGRVDSLPDVFTTFYGFIPAPVPQWVAPGNAVLDDLNNTGRNGWISLAAQFFKANSELSSFRLFVNGEDVTPSHVVNVGNLIAGAQYEILTVGNTVFTTLGAADDNVGTTFTYNGDTSQAGSTGTVLQSGNLDPLNGITDVPVTLYPGAGRGSPAPGDYLAYAQVTDRQGEVGTSAPLAFTIVPYEPLEITLTGPASEEVEQGTAVEFLVEVTPNVSVESVEFFDSDSGESLGFASGVEIEGEELYRFIQSFNQIGNYGVFVRALAFNGQSVDSSPFRLTVTPLDDLEVNLIQPTSDQTLYVGGSLDFVAEASSSAGVTSVSLLVDNVVVDTAPSVPYRFNYLFDTAGGPYNVRVTALDNYGNVAGATEEVNVTVIPSNLTVEIDSPTNPGGDLSYTLGDSIDLEITANDVDAFVTQVEIFNGETSLGIATGVGGDQYRYTIDTATAGIAPGTLNLSARATNNIGNNEDALLSVNLSPVVFSVSFIDPTGNPLELIAAAGEFFNTSYTFTVEVGGITAGALQSLVWQLDSQDPVEQADLGTGLSFSQSFTIDTCATLFVTATNVDGVAVTTSLAIGTSFPDPVSDSSDFVDYIYYQIRGTAPSQAEKDAALGYLVNNGDNAATRAELTAGLYPDSQLLGSRQTLVALVYKTVTGQWPTAAEMESALLLLETDPEALVSQTVEAQSGDINSGGSETFTFNYTAGTEVSVRVSPDGSNGNPLSDPTLTVNDPNGTFVGFSDDNFGSGTFSLDAVLTFTATQPGDYTATVRGFSSFQSGDFAIVSTSVSTESNNDLLLARVLVESLQDSYNGANGFLADSDVPNSGLAPQFVSQIYRNKHGVGITNFNSSTLGARLTGTDEDMGNGYILPGYSGDVLTFVAAFALDTELAVGPLASLKTADGYRYTSQLFYGRPNNPLSGWNAVATDLQDEFNIAKAVSDLLPNLENPDLTEYDGMTLEVALATIFIDPDFITQFPGSCVATPPVSPVEAAVASALVVAGEQQLTGLTDDADGDGNINLIEYALGGDPVDASNGAVVLQSIEAPALAAGPQTFVLTYVQLEERPAGMSIIVECSTDLIQWQAADPFSPVPAADQSGVPVGYERVEYRVILDPVAQSCMFRVAVQVE